MARDAPGRLVDPVGRVQKAMEKANSVRSLFPNPENPGPIFESVWTVCCSRSALFAYSTLYGKVW